MARASNDKTYNFDVEWYDLRAREPRLFSLAFFSLDNSVEMTDTRNHRTFLKRTPYPDVSLDDFFVGAQVTIFARQLRVLSFGDAFTEQALGSSTRRLIAFLTPAALPLLGQLIDDLQADRVQISRMRSMNLSRDQAVECVGAGPGSDEVVQSLCYGTSVAMELVGDRCVELLRRPGVVISQSSSEAEARFLFENPAVTPKVRAIT